MAYRYQQCHCLAALPAKMSVFNSHTQGSHSVISNKVRLRTKINPYSYNKSRAVADAIGVQWCPDPHLKSAPISCSVPRLLHISNIVFKNVAPLVVFGAPCCEVLETGLSKNKKLMLRTKKYECAYLNLNDNRILI